MNGLITPNHGGGRVEAGGHRPADFVLSEEAAARITDGLAENTRRSYKTQWDQYAAWCRGEERSPLPATEETLASYVSYLADRELAPNSIRTAMGVVQAVHKVAGARVNTHKATLALKSYSRERARAGHRTRKARAVSVDELRQTIEQTSPDTIAGMRDRALLTLGYSGMFRRSELSALDLSDVVQVEDGLEVYIATSKTDRDSEGAVARIPYGTHRATCPVRSVLAYVNALEQRGVGSGPLFRGVDRHDRLGGTPGVAGRTSERLSGAGVAEVIKRLAAAAGVPGVLGHSLRAGAATAAAQGGARRDEIAAGGRWNPKSSAVDGYIRPVDEWRDNAARKMGL